LTTNSYNDIKEKLGEIVFVAIYAVFVVPIAGVILSNLLMLSKHS